MLRSPWFWLTILLIAAGVALTATFGVLGWFALALAVAVLILDGVLLFNAYVIPPADPPHLPELKPTPNGQRILVIHDCDLTMGRPFRDVGDGLALLYLLGEPKVDLCGVTTTYGNGPVGMTTRTTKGLLRQLDLQGVKVVRGADGPNEDPRNNKAARYLADAAKAHPKEMVVLASGAMTNLKHAWALDDTFFKNLRGLCLVGGVLGDLSWRERPLKERNFSVDPRAAYQAIQADCPTTITLGEAGLTAIFRSPQFAALRALDDPASRVIVKRARLWFGLMRLWFGDDGFAMWDSIAALAIAHPNYLNLQRVHLPVTIDDLRTGRLVTDPHRMGPVRLVHGVDNYDGFIETQFAAWQRLGRSIETDRRGRE